MKQTLKRITQNLISICFWISVWAVASYKINNSFLMPSPGKTFAAVLELIKTTEFWRGAFNTLGRIFVGIFIATVIGIVLAVATTKISFFDALFSPAMSAVKATPVASFAFLAFLFIDLNLLPVFISALLVVPIVWTNVSAGIKGVSKEHKEVAKIYNFSTTKKLTKLYIPNILPYFLAACRSSIGLAWKAGVAAEVLCPSGLAIGTELYFAKTNYETEKLFAITLLTIIFSIVLEKLILSAISKLPIRSSVSNTEVRA